MFNGINSFLHKSFDPGYYHRQFENDLPNESSKVKRVALLVLPFVSLYRPVGNAISLTMGSVRVVTSCASVITADKMSARVQAITQVALSSLALAGACFQFSLGLYLTTAVDILTNAYETYKALKDHDYKRAVDILLQGINSALYLSIMVAGSIELILISFLVQAATNLYQAKGEWNHKHIPEMVAKALMGCIRLYQANGQYQILLKRNDLLKRYEELIKGIERAKKIDHLANNTLDNTSQAILTDANNQEHDFGKHIHGYGGKLVKGMNIAGDTTSLEFKINHVFREKVEALIQQTEGASDEDLNALLRIFGSHIQNVKIIKTTHTIGEKAPVITASKIRYIQQYLESLLKRNPESSSIFKNTLEWLARMLHNPSLIKQPETKTADAYEIHLSGVGKITIGATKDLIAHYDRVRIDLDKGKNLYDMHEALSFLQLDEALHASTQEDILRMKMGQLFRIFDPQNATQFERTSDYFDLSLDAFTDELKKRSPVMEEALSKWLPNMQLQETLPGKYRYSVNGLADALQAKGALGLTAALMGAMTEEEMIQRTASILKMGMLSSETRQSSTLGKQGLSWGIDLFTGGSDSVFTQLVTDSNTSYNDFSYYSSKIRFLISPKALEAGSYQYHDDNFGVRIVDKDHRYYDQWKDAYSTRQNMFDFIQDEKSTFNPKNEVMIKERISPEFLTGIWVASDSLKENAIAFFREKNIVQLDANGTETIFSKPLDQFIIVNESIKADHFVAST